MFPAHFSLNMSFIEFESSSSLNNSCTFSNKKINWKQIEYSLLQFNAFVSEKNYS